MEKDIVGYEGLYRINKDGEVISLIGRYKNVKTLKQGVDRGGYRIVTLCKDGIHKTKTVHRLVTDAFYGKSSLQVNHKDGNKSNNKLSNLELVSAKDNMNHAVKNGLLVKNFEKIAVDTRKKVRQYKDGNLIGEYVSAHEASRQTGYNRGNISTCCRTGKVMYGCEWRYV
jgi:ribosomal protein S16